MIGSFVKTFMGFVNLSIFSWFDNKNVKKISKVLYFSIFCCSDIYPCSKKGYYGLGIF